jgi:AraC-like DNA-binding protein
VTSPVHRVIQHRSAIPGIEAMTLFTNHAFPRHAHEQFGIGIMTSGAQRSWSIIGHVESQSGDVIMVNPGELHDGMPAHGTPRGWRILYLDPVLVADHVTEDLKSNDLVVRPVARDRALAHYVVRLFALVEERTPDLLGAEECLSCCLMIVGQRHCVSRPLSAGRSPMVRRAVQRLDDAPDVQTSLAELAALSGVSRFQLLRGFGRDVGATPHAYLIQRRVQRARQLLAAGRSPADAAMLAGFADQSHMTRAFRRQFGITPGRYRAALHRSLRSGVSCRHP